MGGKSGCLPVTKREYYESINTQQKIKNKHRIKDIELNDSIF